MKGIRKAILVPSSWMNAYVSRIGGGDTNDYVLIGVKEPVLFSARHIEQSIKECLHDAGAIEQVVIVLPTKFGHASMVSKWPSMLVKNGKQKIVVALLFADSFEELEERIALTYKAKEKSSHTQVSMSCQYQSPYTDMLDDWEQVGATAFHPGDFHKAEMLASLQSMQGDWIYCGHGDQQGLRGYGYLSSKELIQFKPATPLNNTVWLSCSTLARQRHMNVGLEWWWSGATQCLLASNEEVKTEYNQWLHQELINRWHTHREHGLGYLLQSIVMENTDAVEKLKTYRLLGIPWL